MGAQALIQSSVMENVGTKAIFSDSSAQIGYAVVIDVALSGKAKVSAATGTMTAKSPPYTYSLLGSANVKATVPGQAGQKLAF